MKIFGRTQTLQQPLMASARHLHKCGVDGVELCIENQDTSLVLTETYAKRACEALNENGMMRSVSWHDDYVRNDEVFNLMKQAIALTPLFGTKTFVCGGAPAHGENGMSRDWRDWKGGCHGYEGMLVENYHALLAVLDDVKGK